MLFRSLRRLSEAEQSTWFGLRLGATLAALAANRGSAAIMQPNRIILWDAIFDGALYRNELRDAHLTSARLSYGARWAIEHPLHDALTVEAESEALGFPLTPTLKSRLDALTSSILGNVCADRVVLLNGPNAHNADKFLSTLRERNIAYDQRLIKTAIEWASNEAMSSSIVPPEVLSVIDSEMVGKT